MAGNIKSVRTGITKVALKTTSGSYGWGGGTTTAPSSVTIDIKTFLPTSSTVNYKSLTNNNFFGLAGSCWYSNSKHGDSYYTPASVSYNASTGILTCMPFYNREAINPNTSSGYNQYTILPTTFYMIY